MTDEELQEAIIQEFKRINVQPYSALFNLNNLFINLNKI